MALVDTFCVDRWEASLVELAGRGRERAFPPNEMVKGRRVRAVSRAGMFPQAYISRNEAEAACKASRKRLCTETEWVRACKGRRASLFPYGDARKPGYCNDAGVSPLGFYYPNAGASTWGFDAMNDPRLNRHPGTLARAGAFRRCANAYGLFDMVGNVHEWVDDPGGTFRGGYYLDTHQNGDGCDYRTVAHDASYHDYSTGFRCCANPRR